MRRAAGCAQPHRARNTIPLAQHTGRSAQPHTDRSGGEAARARTQPPHHTTSTKQHTNKHCWQPSKQAKQPTRGRAAARAHSWQPTVLPSSRTSQPVRAHDQTHTRPSTPCEYTAHRSPHTTQNQQRTVANSDAESSQPIRAHEVSSSPSCTFSIEKVFFMYPSPIMI